MPPLPFTLTTTLLSLSLSLSLLTLPVSSSKIVYRRYASLYFVAGVPPGTNELSVLEEVHLFVEVLDRYFGNVCEVSRVWLPANNTPYGERLRIHPPQVHRSGRHRLRNPLFSHTPTLGSSTSSSTSTAPTPSSSRCSWAGTSARRPRTRPSGGEKERARRVTSNADTNLENVTVRLLMTMAGWPRRIGWWKRGERSAQGAKRRAENSRSHCGISDVDLLKRCT